MQQENSHIFVSNANSSEAEEWILLFEKFDLNSNDRLEMDGSIR